MTDQEPHPLTAENIATSKGLELTDLELDKEPHSARTPSPNINSTIIVGILAALLALFGNLFVSGVDSWNKSILADKQLRSDLILTAVRDVKEEIAIENLQFYLDVGLLDDPEDEIAEKLKEKSIPRLVSSATSPKFNLVQNSGFEQNGGWQFSPQDLSAEYVQAPLHPVYHGERSVLLGVASNGDAIVGQSTVKQKLTIPQSARFAYLEAWIYYASPMTRSGQEFQDIVLLNEQSQVIDILLRVSRNDQTWVIERFDVSEHIGETLFLAFRVFNQSGDSSPVRMYVDDVAIYLSN